MKSITTGDFFSNDFKRSEVDPMIHYPCYKSLDEFIDVDRLRLLDAYLAERIKRRIESKKEEFFVNLHRLEESSPYQPGVREIWLSRTRNDAPDEHLDLVDEAELWELTKDAEDFAQLMDFIETLPFQKKGRMLIIYDDVGKVVPAHRDHLQPEICHEFIWFRTNLMKPFYVLNEQTNEKLYVESYSAWFDSVNQYHGSDAADGLTFSIRVDGKFTEEFKKRIPQPKFNPASTPAYWACAS